MKLFFTLLFCSFLFIINAQTPKEISYQGIARNTSGSVLANQAIGVQFQIHQGSASGTIVFSETHSTSTNAFGLFTLAIGSANPSGFNTIDWSQSPYFIEVSIDPTGGTSYISVGTSPLISVPYALYAEKAGNATPVPTISINSPNTVSNPSTGIYNITVPSQTLNLAGNTLSISDGNTVTLPVSPTYTAGSGVDLTGNVITNTAPDQTITISGTGVTGVYPNFTITPVSSPSTTLVQGQNVLLNQVGNTYTVSSVTSTLTVSGNSISISPGNTQILPTYSLTQSGGNIDLTQNGASIATVTLSASTSTSLTAGNANITLNQSGNNYTITSVTPTLNVVGGTLSGAYPSQTLTIPTSSTTALTGSTNITVSGVAPNYTISSPSQSLSVSGNSLSISGANTVTIPTSSVVSGNSNITVIPSGNTFSVSAVTPTLNVVGGTLSGAYPSQTLTIPTSSTTALTGSTNITVSGVAPNYTISSPSQSLALVGNTLSITGANTVTIPATTVTAGSNVTVLGTSPNYTVSAPNYVLGAASNSITLTNGVNSSSVAVPVQSLSLVGTTLTAGPTTNSVNLATLPGNWTVTSGVIYPTAVTNSVGIGTSGPLTDKMEINHSSTPTNTHLHLKQTGADAFSRIKFSNAVAPTKYWINSVTSAATDNNSGFNVYYNNGAVGRNLFTIAGDGKVSVNPFSLPYPTLFEVNGRIELDSTIAFNGLNTIPPTSLPGTGRIYYDVIAQKFKVSENGGVWVDLIGGGLSPWIQGAGIITQNNLGDYVGIGTNAPSSPLHIYGSADPLQMTIENTGGNFRTGVRLKTALNEWFIGQDGIASTGFRITDVDASSVRLQIDQTGNVGIGTTSPIEKLDINGNAKLDSSLIVQGLTSIPQTSFGGNGRIYFDQPSGKFKVSENGGAYVNLIPGVVPAPWMQAAGSVTLANNGDKVGIGNSAPSSKLEVWGVGSTSATTSFFVRDNAGNPVLQTTDDRKVLIGSTGASSGRVQIWGFGNTGATTALHVVNTSSSSLFLVRDDGNVGVGILNPLQKLEVAGNVQVPATNEYMFASAKTKYLSIASVAFRSEAPTSYECTFLSGCLYSSGTTPGTATYFDAPITIPDGATVTAVDAYVVDNDANYNISGVWLWQQPGTVGSTYGGPVIMANTPASAGQSAVIQKLTTTTISIPVINNQNNSYYIRVGLAQATTLGDIRLAKVVVTYNINKTE